MASGHASLADADDSMSATRLSANEPKRKLGDCVTDKIVSLLIYFVDENASLDTRAAIRDDA